MSTGAELIARRLQEAGCRHAFGIPGGEVLALMAALDAVGVKFSLCKHENAGGFMAEGTHHVTGAPAVLIATIGPGAANMVNVVANAWQDRVPMIVLTAAINEAEAASYTHQVFDHKDIFKPITKASLTVADGAVDVIIDKALAIALGGQPGPVHLDLPIDVATKEQPDALPVRRNAISPSVPADTAEFEAARALLSQAERPVMIAGVDALNSQADEEIAALAREFNIPVLTTYKAKGIFPESDAMCFGAAGLSPKADDILLPFVQSADLVLLAGYDPIEMRKGWQNPWGSDCKVIEFTSVPNTHYMHQATYSFVGDCRHGLRAFRKGVQPRQTWANGELKHLKAKLDTAFPADEAWGPAAVIDEVRKATPSDIVAGVDTGAHRILLSQMWACEHPRTLLQSTGLCTMGCALPLAIGASLAADGKPSIAFTGDAGLEMILGELATLRDLKLPVIIIVFVDASLALIELKQRGMQMGNLGVDFGATDFVGVGKAMGGHAVQASDRATLNAEVTAGLERKGFTLIACPIGERPYDGRI